MTSDNAGAALRTQRPRRDPVTTQLLEGRSPREGVLPRLGRQRAGACMRTGARDGSVHARVRGVRVHAPAYSLPRREQRDTAPSLQAAPATCAAHLLPAGEHMNTH